MITISWSAIEQEKAYAMYIGRSGCKKCKGVDILTASDAKRLTIAPKGVDNCQIDVPIEHVQGLIDMLQTALDNRRLTNY